MANNKHSRKAQAVLATQAGNSQRFETISAAAAKTGASPPLIKKAIESGEAVTVRRTGLLWSFAAAGDEAAEILALPRGHGGAIVTQRTAPARAIAMSGGAGGVGEVSLPAALAAIASMAAGIGSLALTNLKIKGDGNGWELEVGKVEVLRG